MGGERQPERTEDDDNDIHLKALENLRALLDLKSDPVFRHRAHWPQAIPLPDHGQDARLAVARRITTTHPGLHLTGSHLTGVSLPDCITGALKESAEHG